MSETYEDSNIIRYETRDEALHFLLTGEFINTNYCKLLIIMTKPIRIIQWLPYCWENNIITHILRPYFLGKVYI